jgi:hypothetical protein
MGFDDLLSMRKFRREDNGSNVDKKRPPEAVVLPKG